MIHVLTRWPWRDWYALRLLIEPQLLQQLRRQLLPNSDVGAEADFWFSALVGPGRWTASFLTKMLPRS